MKTTQLFANGLATALASVLLGACSATTSFQSSDPAVAIKAK